MSARLIVVLWAGFWILFAVGSAISGGGKTNIQGILTIAAIILVCAGAVYLAWRRPLIAGISLTLIGIVIAGAYIKYVSRSNLVLLIIGLPPLLSGILFLLSSTRHQNA